MGGGSRWEEVEVGDWYLVTAPERSWTQLLCLLIRRSEQGESLVCDFLHQPDLLRDARAG